MISEWLLVIITGLYVFLTYRIVVTMKETNAVSKESLLKSTEMIAELKSDRDLRFRPYIVPEDCNILGNSEKDQFVMLKNAGSGPAIGCMIILVLLSNDNKPSMMIGQVSMSVAPGIKEKNPLINFDYHKKKDTLISFFPEKFRDKISSGIETGEEQKKLFNVLGFNSFGNLYFISYSNLSGKSFLYKGGLLKVGEKYKIESNPEFVQSL